MYLDEIDMSSQEMELYESMGDDYLEIESALEHDSRSFDDDFLDLPED